MKIVHIQQYYNDNMGYQENILPKYHAKLGHEVIVITSNLGFGFKGINRNYKIGEYKEDNVIIKRIGIYGEFKNRFVFFKNLKKILDDLKPDYIYHHSVTALSLKMASQYKKENKDVFLVTDNHADLNISGRNKVWKFIYYNVFWKKFINKYDKYIDLHFGVTPSRCLFLEEELGVKKNKIRLLPIGADVEHAKNVDFDLLKKFQIEKDNFKIVHGGKITKAKECDKLINAFKKIKNEKVNLILFGKIEDSEIAELIQDDNRIKYIGWLNRIDTLSLLSICDLGIWNTQHTTLLEDSIATELPLILRYYGSTSHLIDETGMFLYNGSVREIYDKLNFIINNKNLLNKFKYNCKELKKTLSYENIAKESISYMHDSNDKEIHKKFMDIRYSDYEYDKFRKI